MGQINRFNCSACDAVYRVSTGRGMFWEPEDEMLAYSCSDCGAITSIAKKEPDKYCGKCHSDATTPLDFKGPNVCPNCKAKTLEIGKLEILWD